MKSLVRLLLHLWRVPSTVAEQRRAAFGPAPEIDVETMLREGRY